MLCSASRVSSYPTQLSPDYIGIELGIGESLLIKAISESTGRNAGLIKADLKKEGDLGLVAMNSKNSQRTLFKPKPLTLPFVFSSLKEIALSTGHSVRAYHRLRYTAGSLFISHKPRKCLSSRSFLLHVKTLRPNMSCAVWRASCASGTRSDQYSSLWRMRQSWPRMRSVSGRRKWPSYRLTFSTIGDRKLHGEKLAARLEESTNIVKAVYRYALAFASSARTTERVVSELPSYDKVIPALLDHGIDGLREHCKLSPGVPLKPMLAKPTKAIGEVLDRFENKRFTCEYKYDGERAQVCRIWV